MAGGLPQGIQPAEESRSVLLGNEEAPRLIHQEPHRGDAAQRGLDENPDPENADGGERVEQELAAMAG